MLVTARSRDVLVHVRFTASPAQRQAFHNRYDQERAALRQRNVINHGTVAGVMHEQSRDGTWKKWTGERARLLDLGVCREDQFPEGHNRQKYGENWSVHRLPGGLFEYAVTTPRDEAKPLRGPNYDSADAWRTSIDVDAELRMNILEFDMSGEWERRHCGATNFSAWHRRRLSMASFGTDARPDEALSPGRPPFWPTWGKSSGCQIHDRRIAAATAPRSARHDAGPGK